ncbi:MAG: nucleotidyltransferase [Myxococcota bacterium]
MIDYPGLLRALGDAGIDFIIVGGAAATAHGAARLTQDLDIVYARDPSNLARLAAALAPHEPYLRGAPADLPFQLDADTLRRGLNFTLTSKLGDIDLLGEIVGGGGYDALVGDAIEIELFGVRCRCLGLDKLIEVKRAAGRPKDLEALAELEAIREERGDGR